MSSQRERIKELERECAGYKAAVKACEDSEGKTVVVLVHGDTEMRIYGPTPEREQAFAEQVAHWFKIVNIVGSSLMFKESVQRVRKLKQVREWAASLIPGNIEAQTVVDEIDLLCKGLEGTSDE